jgi:hypothetical protein
VAIRAGEKLDHHRTCNHSILRKNYTLVLYVEIDPRRTSKSIWPNLSLTLSVESVQLLLKDFRLDDDVHVRLSTIPHRHW